MLQRNTEEKHRFYFPETKVKVVTVCKLQLDTWFKERSVNVFFLGYLEGGGLVPAQVSMQQKEKCLFISDLYPSWVCGETLQSVAAVMFPKVQPGKVMQTAALTCLKSLLGMKYK